MRRIRRSSAMVVPYKTPIRMKRSARCRFASSSATISLSGGVSRCNLLISWLSVCPKAPLHVVYKTDASLRSSGRPLEPANNLYISRTFFSSAASSPSISGICDIFFPTLNKCQTTRLHSCVRQTLASRSEFARHHVTGVAVAQVVSKKGRSAVSDSTRTASFLWIEFRE